ncbi:MAG: phage holin family protein [Verrucomicrobiaceae bacterium]|nr:phage holin family protein [Verrucomicrobiaceae bacterium]
MPAHAEPPTPATLNASVRSLLAATLDYLDTRWQLLKTEAADAARHSLRGLVFALVALLAAITAYLTGILALTLWLARHFWQGDVLPAAVAVLFFNLLLATAALLLMRRAFRTQSFFPHSVTELQNDRPWLPSSPTASPN